MHFQRIIQLCVTPTSTLGFSFGGFPPISPSAHCPCSFMEHKSFGRLQRHKVRAVLTLPVALWWSLMAGHGLSLCLLLREPHSFGTVWELAFRRQNTSKDAEISSMQVRSRHQPKEWASCMHPHSIMWEKRQASSSSSLCFLWGEQC